MKLIAGLIIFVIVLLLTIRYIESRSIYFPMKGVTANPNLVDVPYEEVNFFSSDNKRLNGWFITNPSAKYTILFAHGNAGNIGHRLEKIRIFYDLGVNIFVFDYRGYGESQGAPSESGLRLDALAAYKYLTQERQAAADDIILYGESIGGAVAIDLANRVDICALITEDTFTSIGDIVKKAMPLLPAIILSTKFDSLSKIKNIPFPKLIIHSQDDEIVPFNMGERLYEAADAPKTFLKLRGGHNTAYLESLDQYKEGIKSFLNTL